jgi:hypothetical protein
MSGWGLDLLASSDELLTSTRSSIGNPLIILQFFLMCGRSERNLDAGLLHVLEQLADFWERLNLRKVRFSKNEFAISHQWLLHRLAFPPGYEDWYKFIASFPNLPTNIFQRNININLGKRVFPRGRMEPVTLQQSPSISQSTASIIGSLHSTQSS